MPPIATHSEIWSRFYPERYRIDDALFEQNVFGCRLTIRDASVLDREDGFIVVKASAPGRVFPGHESNTAHISAIAFDDDALGDELWDHAFRTLRKEGIESVSFGGDWRHFFPGCPVDCERLASFLERKGMVASETLQYDLERNLASYEPPVTPTVEARPCVASDYERLDEFLAREFPGRWHTDVMGKFTENPSRVTGLFLRGLCEGFAMTQLEGDTNRYAGAVWSADLGSHWGALGPIGVSKGVRGQGYGDGVLAAALCYLRDQGAQQTIIDWTTLVDFYGRHGFEVTRMYRTYTMKLEPQDS